MACTAQEAFFLFEGSSKVLGQRHFAHTQSLGCPRVRSVVALGACQRIARPGQRYTVDAEGRGHTRVSNLCCYSEAALLAAQWKPRRTSSCLSQTLSAQNKQVPTLRMPWYPEKKNRGCVSPEKGLLGTSTESKERGRLWTAGATPDCASDATLPGLKQPLASIPLPSPPTRPCPAQTSGKCGPALALLLSLFLAETLERSGHSHCFSNNVVTKEKLNQSSGDSELSSDPRRKEAWKSCLRFQGHPSPCHRRCHSLRQPRCFFKSTHSVVWGSCAGF